MNFTSNYLGLLKSIGKLNEITDGTVPISTIKIPDEFEMISYSKPKLVYDKFSTSEELSEPDIKKIADSLQAVRELGFEIVSLNVKRGWFKKQITQYKMRRASLISDDLTVLNAIPPKHYIEFDRANKRIRMVGKNCINSKTGIVGTTEWVT